MSKRKNSEITLQKDKVILLEKCKEQDYNLEEKITKIREDIEQKSLKIKEELDERIEKILNEEIGEEELRKLNSMNNLMITVDSLEEALELLNLDNIHIEIHNNVEKKIERESPTIITFDGKHKKVTDIDLIDISRGLRQDLNTYFKNGGKLHNLSIKGIIQKIDFKRINFKAVCFGILRFFKYVGLSIIRFLLYLKSLCTKQTLYRILSFTCVLCICALVGYTCYSYNYIVLHAKDEKNEQETEIVENTEKSYRISVDMSGDEVESPSEKWDFLFKKKIAKYLSNYTFMSLTQTTTTFVKDSVTNNNVALITELKTDFLNNRFEGSSAYSDSIGQIEKAFFYDKNLDLYLKPLDTDTSKWVKSNITGISLNFDLDDYTTLADFYRHFLSNYDIPTDTSGTQVENYAYFNYVTEAKDTDIIGVEFDELGNTSINLIFEDMGEDGYKPVAMTKQVEFIIGEVTYISKVNIVFDVISTNTLLLPSYQEFLEEEYTVEDKEETDEVDLKVSSLSTNEVKLEENLA